jgi:hypothetical protein
MKSPRSLGEEGASLVEFAIVLPLFALLLFALIDFGLAFGGFVTLRNGVSAGARLAAVDQVDPSCVGASNPMVCTIADHIGTLPGMEPGTLTIGIAFVPQVGAIAGDEVEVCASAKLASSTGITAPILGGKAIHAESIERLEQDPTYQAAGSCPAAT